MLLNYVCTLRRFTLQTMKTMWPNKLANIYLNPTFLGLSQERRIYRPYFSTD